MAARRLRIEEHAEAEAREAFLWYLVRNPDAATRFQLALEECMSGVIQTPERYPEMAPGVRRRLVQHGFPYGVIYRLAGDEIQVVAVMHLHRRPGYWRT